MRVDECLVPLGLAMQGLVLAVALNNYANVLKAVRSIGTCLPLHD